MLQSKRSSNANHPMCFRSHCILSKRYNLLLHTTLLCYNLSLLAILFLFFLLYIESFYAYFLNLLSLAAFSARRFRSSCSSRSSSLLAIFALHKWSANVTTSKTLISIPTFGVLQTATHEAAFPWLRHHHIYHHKHTYNNPIDNLL